MGITWDHDDSEPGVKVMTVTADSPAAHGGLRPGDRIVELDGSPITKAAELTTAIHAAREPVKLSIERAGSETAGRVRLSCFAARRAAWASPGGKTLLSRAACWSAV